MHEQIIHLPNLEKGKAYKVQTVSLDSKPNFTMTGNPMKSLDLIANFTKPEAFAFILLKDCRDYESNYVHFSTRELTDTEKNIFSKGYKAMAGKKLVTRVSKGVISTYLFNPDFIIPKNYTPCLAEWNKLTTN